MRTIRDTPCIIASREAIFLASRHALEGLPRETGGILIGWREGSAILVDHFLVVPDHEATARTFWRRQRAADRALTQYLSAGDDPRLGYVGEWHSHPAPQPASETDLQSIAAIAKQLRAPLGLVVLMVSRDRVKVSADGVVARRRGILSPVVQRVDVIVD